MKAYDDSAAAILAFVALKPIENARLASKETTLVSLEGTNKIAKVSRVGNLRYPIAKSLLEDNVNVGVNTTTTRRRKK